MKAVLYHADGIHGKRFTENLYKHLTLELKKNLHSFNINLIHLTVEGHEGWGDEDFFYKVNDVNEVIYNREKCIVEFLKNDADPKETYWFLEPDFRLIKEFPPLTTDVCMLLRDDPVAMTPAWRLAKKSALPFFEEAFSYFDLNAKDWHGDSVSWIKIYENLKLPKECGIYNYKGITLELRPYGWYASRSSKAIYSKQWKGGSKMQIVTQEYIDGLKK